MSESPSLRTTCGTCGKSLKYALQLVGRKVACPKCSTPITLPAAAPANVQLPGRDGLSVQVQGERNAGAVQSAPYLAGVRVLHPGWMIPLNIFTVNIFSSIWLNLLHGQLPQRRPDDPSGLKAVLLLFVPIYNFYWYFFSYFRLQTRINEELATAQMPRLRLGPLFLLVFVAIFVPIAGPIVNTFFLMPLMATTIQSRLNGLSRLRQGYWPRSLAGGLAAHWEAGATLRKTWAIYLWLLGIALFAAFSALIYRDPSLDNPLQDAAAVAVNVVVFSAPLLIGGGVAFWRGRRMRTSLEMVRTGDVSGALKFDERSSRALCWFVILWSVLQIILIAVAAFIANARGRTTVDEDFIPVVLTLCSPWVVVAGWQAWSLRSLNRQP